MNLQNFKGNADFCLEFYSFTFLTLNETELVQKFGKTKAFQKYLKFFENLKNNTANMLIFLKFEDFFRLLKSEKSEEIKRSLSIKAQI